MKTQRTVSAPLNIILGLVAVVAAAAIVAAQPPAGAPPQEAEQAGAETEITLRWPARPRVERYRVQVASDPRFSDIVFDGAVEGVEKKVTGLAPGKYYWRVAPAQRETGRYSRAEPIEVSPAGTSVAAVSPTPRPTATPNTTATPRTAATPRATATPRASRTPRTTETPAVAVAAAPAAAVIRPPRDVGWQAAVGRVQRPVSARLRQGQSTDLVGVNADGTVYALEGQTGVPLWSARFRTARPGGATAAPPAEVFTPLVYTPKGATSNVVAAFDGGLRLHEGETGRELWRATLPGRPVSGSVVDLDGNEETLKLAVVTEEPAELLILEAATGRVVSQTKIQGKIVGVPVPYMAGAERGVAIALEGGQLDIRKADGTRLRGIRFDVPFTTPPLIIASQQGTLIVIGTEHGLLFLNGAQLAPLGRVTTEGDSPRGRLAAADFDGDRLLEVAMVTRRGRVAVISATGKINWSAEGGTDAYAAVFADLDRDGALDVLVADEGVFARALSGRDGRMIWQVDDDPATKPATGGGNARLRTLAVSTGGDGVPLIIGGDLNRNALRAVGLPAPAGGAPAK